MDFFTFIFAGLCGVICWQVAGWVVGGRKDWEKEYLDECDRRERVLYRELVDDFVREGSWLLEKYYKK